MRASSLQHAGEECLRQPEALDAADAVTTGIALLYPWANRLADAGYCVAGKSVQLDLASPLLLRDENGLPNHGVRSRFMAWHVLESTTDRVTAGLAWSDAELLAVFPFRHRLEMCVTLSASGLHIETTLYADEPLPVSFGFHPNFCIPGMPRAQWQLTTPAMCQLVLDDRRIPTGARERVETHDGALGVREIDAAYALEAEHAALSIASSRRRLTMEMLNRFSYAQIYAPREQDFISLEPMTAPPNALRSAQALVFAMPGQPFRAAFRIRTEMSARPADHS